VQDALWRSLLLVFSAAYIVLAFKAAVTAGVQGLPLLLYRSVSVAGVEESLFNLSTNMPCNLTLQEHVRIDFVRLELLPNNSLLLELRVNVSTKPPTGNVSVMKLLEKCTGGGVLEGSTIPPGSISLELQVGGKLFKLPVLQAPAKTFVTHILLDSWSVLDEKSSLYPFLTGFLALGASLAREPILNATGPRGMGWLNVTLVFNASSVKSSSLTLTPFLCWGKTAEREVNGFFCFKGLARTSYMHYLWLTIVALLAALFSFTLLIVAYAFNTSIKESYAHAYRALAFTYLATGLLVYVHSLRAPGGVHSAASIVSPFYASMGAGLLLALAPLREGLLAGRLAELLRAMPPAVVPLAYAMLLLAGVMLPGSPLGGLGKPPGPGIVKLAFISTLISWMLETAPLMLAYAYSRRPQDEGLVDVLLVIDIAVAVMLALL